MGAIAGTLAVAAGAAAGLAAGCGSGGTQTSSISTVGTDTQQAALSQSQYIREADQICAESDAAVNAISPGATVGEQAASTSQQVQIMRDELSSIQALGTPTGATPSRFLSALSNVGHQISRKHLALERGDETALPGIVSSIDAAESRAQSAAQDYGFKSCGDFGVPSGTTTSTSGTSTVPAPTTTTPATTTPVPAPPAPTPAPVPPTGGGAGTPPSGGGTGGSSGGVGAGSGGVGAG
jgi:hypothetical protein